VTVWYTAPTAIRMLMKAGADLARQYDLSSCCGFLASVGEPLNPEAVVWGREAFGLPFHDNWWQTETGGIMIANYASMDIRPRLDGQAAARHRGRHRQAAGRWGPASRDHRAGRAGRTGPAARLAVDVPRLLERPERYRKCFADGWYLTGDLARRDADGYFWFVGRKDDVIKTSGHLIGPFEVESVLMEHPAVAEAGVIGKPDPALEIVKAFVALKPGTSQRGTAARALGLPAAARAAVAPKEIEFVDSLPKTAAARSCGGCSRPASWGCPKGDTRRWKDGMDDCHDRRRQVPDREHGLRCCTRCCAFAASRRSAPSCTASARSAAFLHLYIGEEAVAVGAMQALTAGRRIVATYREHGHALVRAACRPARHGRDVRQGERLQPRARRLDAPVRRRYAVLRRQRDRRRRPAAGRRPGAGRQDAERSRESPLLLRRRRRRRGRVPRVAEPGGAVEAAGAVPVREQPLRDGHALDAAPVPDRSSPQGSGYGSRRVVDGMDVLAVEAAAARRGDVRAATALSSWKRETYRFRAHSMYDAELYRSKDEVEEWKQRDPIVHLHGRS
jgi:hypothetical protein